MNFAGMEQVNQSTGFRRAVRRIVDVGHDSRGAMTTDIDFSTARFGTQLPEEIIKEPQMLLLPGDIIQVSKSRPDGLAFGNKVLTAVAAFHTFLFLSNLFLIASHSFVRPTLQFR